MRPDHDTVAAPAAAPLRPKAGTSVAALPATRVRLVGVEAAWGELAAEWLRDAGLQPLRDDAPVVDATADARCRLVLLGSAFPRRDGALAVQQVRSRWPAAAVLLLSPTIHPGAAHDGVLARALGVQALVALPVTRETLLAVVRRLLGPTP